MFSANNGQLIPRKVVLYFRNLTKNFSCLQVVLQTLTYEGYEDLLKECAKHELYTIMREN